MNGKITPEEKRQYLITYHSIYDLRKDWSKYILLIESLLHLLRKTQVIDVKAYNTYALLFTRIPNIDRYLNSLLEKYAQKSNTTICPKYKCIINQ